MKKKSAIDIFLSKEFFLIFIGLTLLILSLYSWPVTKRNSTLFLYEEKGNLVICKEDVHSRRMIPTENISLRPFLFQKIPVNIASSTLLQTISGIGEKTALSIIRERDMGVFLSYHDLTRVDGIGLKTAKKLEHYLSFETPKSIK